MTEKRAAARPLFSGLEIRNLGGGCEQAPVRRPERAGLVAITLVKDVGVGDGKNAADVFGAQFNDARSKLAMTGRTGSTDRPALRAGLLRCLWQGPAHRHVPDILRIFPDGAIG